jgi:hypothetical protein
MGQRKKQTAAGVGGRRPFFVPALVGNSRDKLAVSVREGKFSVIIKLRSDCGRTWPQLWRNDDFCAVSGLPLQVWKGQDVPSKSRWSSMTLPSFGNSPGA